MDQPKKYSRNWHNSPADLERIKVIFQYCLMISCSAFMGIYFAYLLSDDFLVSTQQIIQTHFQSACVDDQNVSDFISTVFRYALWDILSICALFISSFAIFNYLVADLILIANGFKTAFSVAFLIRILILRADLSALRTLHIFLFFTLRLATLILLLYFAFRCAAYSRRLRTFNKVGRFSIQKEYSSLLF